jgi:hypothetical protein
MSHTKLMTLCLASLLAAGCATVEVTKVTPQNRDTVAGVRYSLPKPFIQVIPQADDTLLVNVIMLPDSDNTYAIKTSSRWSTYSFQLALNPNSTLSAVEFKQDSSAVGQQLAATAGTASTQLYNMKIANAVATQTAVNTAQTAVDSAQSAYDVAAAQVNADKANGASASQLNTDSATEQMKLAALNDAKAVLSRARSTTQVGSYTATVGTPVATTGPTPTTGSNSGFGPQTWSAPVEYELPDAHGAVLYAVNETLDASGKPVLLLQAAKLDGDPQPTFKVSSVASGPPLLTLSSTVVPKGTGSVTLNFTQAVTSVDQCDLFSAAGTKVTGNAKCVASNGTANNSYGSLTLTLPTSPALSAGAYKLIVGFSYKNAADGSAKSTQASPVTVTIQ